MAICVCRYPLLVIDRRDGQEHLYLSIPYEIITDGVLPIPEISLTEKKDYVRVKWKEPENGAKKYDKNGHIVVAGCPEDQLTCDSKNIYDVYHPVEEWYSDHVIELGLKE